MIYARLAILCSLALSMGCAGFKDGARDAAREALEQVTPMLRETGREMLDYAASRFEASSAKVVDQAKGDIGEALKALPAASKEFAANVTADAVAARVATEDPAKAAEFQRRVASDGLPAALEWLFGGGSAAIALGLARLWWRTRGALKVTAKGIESLPPEVAKVAKAAVQAKGGVAFDSEIQGALA